MTAGGPTLAFPDADGIAVGPYATATPAVVVTADGTVASAGYDRVNVNGTIAAATATVVTPNGSRFAFADRWAVTPDGTCALNRRVTVVAAGRGDEGFDTTFGLHVPGAASVADCELFLPGV